MTIDNCQGDLDVRLNNGTSAVRREPIKRVTREKFEQGTLLFNSKEEQALLPLIQYRPIKQHTKDSAGVSPPDDSLINGRAFARRRN
ncbi:MAG: hypothetical protein FIB08_17810 [Candidatus Methanoperedens sp.]|nr:hypothetical protein [Candidatus Methanoperedens sp.]